MLLTCSLAKLNMSLGSLRLWRQVLTCIKQYSHKLTLSTNSACFCPVVFKPPSCTFHTSSCREKKMLKSLKPLVFPKKAKKKPEVTLQVWRNMTVRQLADAMGKDLDHVFEAMIFVENSEEYDSPDSAISDINVLTGVVKKSGMRCIVGANPLEKEGGENEAVKDAERRPPADPESLVKRPPIVTIMGHVDHGKTTLLDSLRHTSVVDQEFGGITQHIGAFTVSLPGRGIITFLDTPGHAAFSAMRARGAHVTDIVVLVVAVDDGVMLQTVESIAHANQAGVPIIVAINKMDKPGVDLDQCKRGLMTKGVQLEDFGGDVQAVPISALKGTNLDALVDAIETQAELMALKADPRGLVEGYVIESRTDPGRGRLSTAIIQRGTLRKGAFLVAGTAWAKVRAMFDHTGNLLQTASPSTPVEVIGWKELPSAGDELLEVETERRAKEVVAYRLSLEMEKKQDEDFVAIQKKMEEHNKVYRQQLEERRLSGRYRKQRVAQRPKENVETDLRPKLAVVLKGDVDGSVEAILDVLDTYNSPECRLDIVHYGVGAISETDIALAESFKGIVYGFNVSVLENAKKLSKNNNVPFKVFNIIYRLVESVRDELNARLPLVEKEEVLGTADVIEEFLVSSGRKKVPVAGCRCSKGSLKKSAIFRVIRGQDLIHEGKLISMRHVKNEVDTIKKDVECGLMMEDKEVRFMTGDTIVCFDKVKIPQKTSWDPGF